MRVRRGAAYCQLGDLSKAVSDYEAALAACPGGDEKIQNDLDEIRRKLEEGAADPETA